MDELQYLLAVLMEECAEVAQRASKGLRFTMEEVQPGQEQTNDQRLAGELNDLLAVVELIQEQGFLSDLRGPDAVFAIMAKKNKVAHYMQYSRERGTLKIEDKPMRQPKAPHPTGLKEYGQGHPQ